MAIELLGDTLADKYETKRDGLTIDEALEAAVLGYHVTSPSIQEGAYVHYEFNGWRIQFVHDGRLGSSSGWTPEPHNQIAEWSIVPDKSEVARDKWGKPVAAKRDSWGRPV